MGRKAVAVAEAALQAAAPTATSAEHAGPAVGTARAPDDLLTAARHAYVLAWNLHRVADNEKTE